MEPGRTPTNHVATMPAASACGRLRRRLAAGWQQPDQPDASPLL